MKVFEPIEIKGMKLKNRIGFPSFLNQPAADEGYVSDVTVRWFEERAKGGAALIMTGAVTGSPVDEQLAASFNMNNIRLYDDKFIPGFKKIADAVHSHGAKLGVQITGLGGPLSGRAPSPEPFPDEEHATETLLYLTAGFRMPITEISVEEIEQAERDIAAAAARAKAAGADCVELHCAHGGATFHCSFISPYYNRRTDKYGGDWEGRLRLPVETIMKIREAVGEDYPILARIDSDQLLGERGITLEDTVKFVVPALEKAGVDCFDVTQGDVLRSTEGILIPLYYPRGCFMHLTAEVKKATKLPVIGVGRILDLDMAERFLQEGKADIIFMGRQLTSDPETPKKYSEGRPEDIRKCIGCLVGCGRPCPINYDMQDAPIALTPAEKPKKVLVLGGGAAGMEAARIAALRGHKVTLMEKEAELGGLVATLALNPLVAEFRNVVDYLTTQMKKLKVDIRLRKEATLADVEELKPAVVILATGSTATIPEVAEGKPGVMTHSEALKRKKEVGKKVAVWGLFGCELAIALAEEGKDVVLLGRSGEGSLATDLSAGRRWYLLRRLTDVNVPRVAPEAMRLSNLEVLYNVKVEDITAEGIKVVATVDNVETKRVIPYDTLILSRRFGERQANDSLFDELQGKVAEVHKIGDCLQVRSIQDAVWTANEVARKI